MAAEFAPVDPTVQSDITAPVGDPTTPSSGHVGIAEASARLGISREGVRQRIRRGQLAATKIDGQWWILLPDPTGEPTSTPTSMDPNQSRTPSNLQPNRIPYTLLTTQLEAENQFLRQECERLHELVRGEQDTRRREVQELHVLLQRAQAQIPMPTLAAPQQVDDVQPNTPEPRRRRWWWPFSSEA